MRRETVDGLGPWIWIKADRGAWAGPKIDWETSHKVKFLQYLKNRNVVVTAGANQGMYVRFYARLFKTVYAFEPDPLNFFCLTNNVQDDNVIKIQGALGSRSDMVSIKRPEKSNTGMNVIQPTGIIPMFALDNFKLYDLNFLQLDVEGTEEIVINGAKDTINKFRPVIALENGIALEDKMKKLGYKIIDQSQADTIFVPE